MKLLLIIPRYNLTNKTNYQYVFPLGLGYISSSLKRANYNIDLINLNHLNGTVEEILNKKLNQTNYDFILTGNIGIFYTITEKIINITKNHPSKPRVI